MQTAQPVTVPDWQAVIRVVASCPTGKIASRRVAFEAAQTLLRGGIEGQDHADDKPFSKLGKSTVTVFSEANKFPTIKSFLETLRSIRLQSLGVHVVDPIAGRLSTIWTRVENPTAENLSKAELYARVWNRIYREMFRPSATLINAIECGVLPWQWNDKSLRTNVVPNQVDDGWFAEPFFAETKQLAGEFQETLDRCISEKLNSGNSHDVDAVVQVSWNELKTSDFVVRLDRVATRFRDSIIDHQSKRKSLCNYLTTCGGQDLPPVLQDQLVTKPSNWDAVLDIVQALQSSILSQPAFCDETGLWVHRHSFKNESLREKGTSIYFIFGLTGDSQQTKELNELAKTTFENLGKAISSLIEIPFFPKQPKVSDLVGKLYDEIKEHEKRLNGQPVNADNKLEYHSNGLQRWLSAVEKLMKDAKHEGHPITYNVGYGSFAYAQSHLHRYEPAPGDLEGLEAPFEKITSYIKGFYSIFGKPARGLWFDELGCYCGVFENADDKDFERTKLGDGRKSHHEDTVLFAKIYGVGFVDIFDNTTNQIARVKDGEFVDMIHGDDRRKKVMETLSPIVIPEADLHGIAKWLVNELIELLQRETHGTSFIISFPNPADAVDNADRSWCSEIDVQTKTLIRRFSKLDTPLATFDQLKNYATSSAKPGHLFDLLAELANLDGGLWLQLSKKSGLVVKAAQQFIPLLKLENKGIRPLDLQMDLGEDAVEETCLPATAQELFKTLLGLKSHFAAINGRFPVIQIERKKYLKALSFLHHSGTKTHSLWGMSMTAAEPCLCIVISSDGNVYIFRDGREFTRLEEDKIN